MFTRQSTNTKQYTRQLRPVLLSPDNRNNYEQTIRCKEYLNLILYNKTSNLKAEYCTVLDD